MKKPKKFKSKNSERKTAKDPDHELKSGTSGQLWLDYWMERLPSSASSVSGAGSNVSIKTSGTDFSNADPKEVNAALGLRINAWVLKKMTPARDFFDEFRLRRRSGRAG